MQNPVDLVSRLIEFRSLSRRELPLAEWIAGDLKAHGVPCILDVFEPSKFRGANFDRQRTANVYVDAGRGDRALLLYAHTDVVDGEDSLFRPIVRQGCLHGRGSVDMKTALAALILAARANFSAIEQSDRRIIFALVADEEEGGTGARQSVEWLRERELGRLSCVLFEPTNGFSEIEVGAKGYVFLSLRSPLEKMIAFLRQLLRDRDVILEPCRTTDRRFTEPHISVTSVRCEPSLKLGQPVRFVGKSIHASRPDLGESASERFLTSELRPISDIVTPGTSHNTIPGEAIAYVSEEYGAVECLVNIDVRTTIEADRDDYLLSRLVKRFDEAGIEYEVMKRGRSYLLDDDSPLLKLCVQSAARPVTPTVSLGGSDAGYYRDLTSNPGPDVVGGFGAGDKQLQHTSEERIPLTEIHECVAVVQRMIDSYLQGGLGS